MADIKCRVCASVLSPQEVVAYRDRCEDCWAGYNDGRDGARHPTAVGLRPGPPDPGAAPCYTGKPVVPIRASSNQIPRRL